MLDNITDYHAKFHQVLSNNFRVIRLLGDIQAKTKIVPFIVTEYRNIRFSKKKKIYRFGSITVFV